ncbi:ATP-binding cassette, subfamily C, CydC [Evansella caseinilytica]|uniref:ATP-binding cassette, subfamily C, CydC n=1 Tax=Evansella caseinilytica TaxID=1503961 RepID=A0A1H3QD82_9BACI|nr:thiol reductant ABC exporter subunit CydC [Evansella caseinilytica]SDZ10689.1 ATP-binding cassette, subfamily C, CydC [Evansella caseinilytica]
MKEIRIVIRLMMAEKKDVLYAILFGFLAGVAAVGLFANSGYLISKAAITPPLYILTISIAVMKLFSVTRAVSRYAERYYSHRATFTILSNLRVHFFERLEPFIPRIFSKYRSGDLLSRIVGDVESLQNFFLRVYYPPLVMVIVFLSTIAFTAFFSVPVAIILIAGLLLTGFAVPAYFAVKQQRLESQLRNLRGTVSTEATEFLYGFRDLKLYQRLEEQEQELTDAATAYVDEQGRVETQALYSQSINQAVSLIISWLVLGAGAYYVSTGQLDGVFLAMLVMMSLTVFENSTPMAAFPVHFEDSRRAAKRLFSVVEAEEDGADAAVKPEAEHTFETQSVVDKPLSIELNHVGFTFPGENRPALRNIDIHLPAGSKTAIVGPSGSGKSTLLQLLLKAYQPSEGEIRLGGTQLSQLGDETVWAGINTVLQKNHFFYGTIRENLQLAGDELTDDELERALAVVKLQDSSLSDEVLEKGENLSGGEKQRLAIARAMLKDAHIWLLDEPTSSVDPLTEKHIFNELLRQGKDDTMVFVSHRLAGLENMDSIIVMNQGTIVESGTFAELQARKGYFYEMKQIEKSVFYH